MKKKVIFTCLTGSIDNLQQPEIVDESFDYICFSDKARGKEGIWQIRQISIDIKNQIILSRLPKLLPHRFLSEYEYSVYIDANVLIREKSFYEFVNTHIKNSDLISQVSHPTRNCIYLELEQCLNTRKVSPWQYIKHHQKYNSAALPKGWGLFENNVILRKHNDAKVVSIDKDWWKEYNSISNRDQLSLMLVYWRHQFLPTLLLGEKVNTRNSSCVSCVSHVGSQNNRSVRLIKRILQFVMRKTVLPLYRRLYSIEDYSSEW